MIHRASLPAPLLLSFFAAPLCWPAGALAQVSTTPPPVMVIGDSHVERLGPELSRSIRRLGGQPLGHLARRGWSTGAYEREGDL